MAIAPRTAAGVVCPYSGLKSKIGAELLGLPSRTLAITLSHEEYLALLFEARRSGRKASAAAYARLKPWLDTLRRQPRNESDDETDDGR